MEQIEKIAFFDGTDTPITYELGAKINDHSITGITRKGILNEFTISFDDNSKITVGNMGFSYFVKS